MRQITVLAGLFVALSFAANAQNLSSPYSVYGVGDIQNTFPDRSSGMANASVSLISTPGFLLNKNPASMIGLERSLGQLDLALTGRTVSFKGNPISSSNSSTKDVTIKRFGVSARLNKWWASGFGYVPFSYVNYQFVGTKNIEGSTSTVNATYEGNGGLNQIFWNNAFAVGKHVAMGVRSSFIFGSINQTETVVDGTNNAIAAQTSTYYNNFRFEYGAIYKGRLSKNLVLGLGGKVVTKTGLRTEETLNVVEGTTTVQSDKQLSVGTFHLPWAYDVGLSVIHKDKTTFSVDYSFDQWSDVKNTITTGTYAMKNSQRLSAGFQISNQIQRFNLSAEKSYFQAGVFAGQSYLQVKGQQLDEYGATLGYGGFLSRGLNFALGLEVGQRGTTKNNLIRENYVQLTLAFSYREVLYSKGRKYD